jgi:hypothetical protein
VGGLGATNWGGNVGARGNARRLYWRPPNAGEVGWTGTCVGRGCRVMAAIEAKDADTEAGGAVMENAADG